MNYVVDALHVECQQVFTRGNDVVDAHLHRSQMGQWGDAVHGFVYTDVGQGELCQQRVAIGRVLYLLLGGIEPHAFNSLDGACSFYCHLAEGDVLLWVLGRS